jgi:hypothetical protein
MYAIEPLQSPAYLTRVYPGGSSIL